MNSLAEDLRQILIDGNAVSDDPTADWAVQIGRFSDKPDQLVCLRDIPSRQPVYLMGKIAIQIDSCKAVIRSTDYRTGYSKGVEVSEIIEMNDQKYINDVGYWGLRRDDSVGYLDTDGNGRHLFEVTFEVYRQNNSKET